MNIKIDLTKKNSEIFGIDPVRAKELLTTATYALNISLDEDMTNKVGIIAKALQAVDTNSIEETIYFTYCVAHKLGQLAAVQKGMVSTMVVEKVKQP